jgi:hypothetical protein
MCSAASNAQPGKPGGSSESFCFCKNQELKELGEYRTQRLALKAFDVLAEEEERIRGGWLMVSGGYRLSVYGLRLSVISNKKLTNQPTDRPITDKALLTGAKIRSVNQSIKRLSHAN